MYLCVCMHLKLERSKPSLLHIKAQETDEKELRNKTDEHKKIRSVNCVREEDKPARRSCEKCRDLVTLETEEK